MQVRTIKAPCGGTLPVRVKDDAEFAARIEQINKDHKEDRGCQFCKPEKWPRTQDIGDGPSLLDP